jgi:hypothetical protein
MRYCHPVLWQTISTYFVGGSNEQVVPRGRSSAVKVPLDPWNTRSVRKWAFQRMLHIEDFVMLSCSQICCELYGCMSCWKPFGLKPFGCMSCWKPLGWKPFGCMSCWRRSFGYMSCWSRLTVCLVEAVWMYILLKPFGCMSCWSRLDVCRAEAVRMYVLLKPFGCMSCWSRLDVCLAEAVWMYVLPTYFVISKTWCSDWNAFFSTHSVFFLHFINECCAIENRIYTLHYEVMPFFGDLFSRTKVRSLKILPGYAALSPCTVTNNLNIFRWRFLRTGRTEGKFIGH